MRPTRVPLTGTLLLGALLLVLTAVPPAARSQQAPLNSVFELVVMTHSGLEFRSTSSGTGFFISPDGTALTNSHVIYSAYIDRINHQLLAILDREFYSATIICASELAYDPAKPPSDGIPVGRDVAEIRLIRPNFPFSELKAGSVVFARAHTGAMPLFTPMAFAGDPTVGEPVRVLGFGRVNSQLPYGWSAEGNVSEVESAADGTPVFGIEFAREAVPGHSGSPVLNARDQVVGIFAWRSLSHNTGAAIGSSALNPVCR